ncbi:MAG: molybdopterin-binding protein [Syntrophomonas sp.]
MIVQILRVEDAVNKVICHDMTRIVRGEYKGPRFKKGHLIKDSDIPDLLNMGKDRILTLELEPGEIHEDEAGIRLGVAAAGEQVDWAGPKESRVNLFAKSDGLLKVNIQALEAINEVPDVILATLPSNTVVKKGDMLAGTKVIPLVVPEATINAVEDICRQATCPVIEVVAFHTCKVGVLITGNEVYKQRIRDAFGLVLSEKLGALGQEILRIEYALDESQVISEKIKQMAADGAGMVIVTGGMSVDPDDVTPKAICQSGARVEKYGAPALPGAMFMLAYLDEVPILGVPACGMFFKITILDLLLPRLLAGERVTRRDIASLAHGGLCRICPECHYPNCTFGKGSD